MILVDIEGTTSSAAYVREHLFPYARQRIPEWIGRPESAELAAAVRKSLRAPHASIEDVAEALLAWHDADQKVTALKSLQGRIWQEGFRRGELTAHVYDDVPPAFRRWIRGGSEVWVYSSGSVAAQRAWFGHTQHGDLTSLLSGYFDTANAGPKKHRGSYARILEAAGAGQPSEVLFLSDDRDELAAADEAGLCAVEIDRTPGGKARNSFAGVHPPTG